MSRIRPLDGVDIGVDRFVVDDFRALCRDFRLARRALLDGHRLRLRGLGRRLVEHRNRRRLALKRLSQRLSKVEPPRLRHWMQVMDWKRRCDASNKLARR